MVDVVAVGVILVALLMLVVVVLEIVLAADTLAVGLRCPLLFLPNRNAMILSQYTRVVSSSLSIFRFLD